MTGAQAFDRLAFALFLFGTLALFARVWLHDHPQHNPWAPLDLRDPPGWATQSKLSALRDEPGQCRAVLDRSGIAFVALDPLGQGECRRADRLTVDALPLTGQPDMTCAVAAAAVLWERRLQPIAEDTLGSRIERIEHFGTHSCRRVNAGETGDWSEHATGNAIDISAFVLADGQRVTVAADWAGEGDPAAFLRRARDEACGVFGTVLSPDYNAAHADHLHFDQAKRGLAGFCR